MSSTTTRPCKVCGQPAQLVHGACARRRCRAITVEAAVQLNHHPEIMEIVGMIEAGPEGPYLDVTKVWPQ